MLNENGSPQSVHVLDKIFVCIHTAVKHRKIPYLTIKALKGNINTNWKQGPYALTCHPIQLRIEVHRGYSRI